MGLGISKPKPKYTPPKVCKKAATVLLPTWNFIACPNVPFVTLKVMLPAELGGLTKDTIAVWRLPRDPGDLCLWFTNQLTVAGFVAEASVAFNPLGPMLTVVFRYLNNGLQSYSYSRGFTDYDSRKPKLLLPSTIPPTPFTDSAATATALITI
jgi:hypothetical protein